MSRIQISSAQAYSPAAGAALLLTGRLSQSLASKELKNERKLEQTSEQLGALKELENKRKLERASETPKLWPHQISAREKFRKENHKMILCMSTGAGKTAVAAQVIRMRLREKKNAKTLFVVPLGLLVGQQEQEIHRWIDVKISPLLSTTIGSWGKEEWQRCFNESDVMIATPQIFINASCKGYLHFEDVHLLIFDEVHHAVNQSSMANLLKLFLRKPHLRPWKLGLTASTINRVVTNKMGAKDDISSLEKLFGAKVYNQNVVDMRKRNFKKVEWKEEKSVDVSAEKKDLDVFLDDLGLGKKDKKKLRNGAIAVLSKLGHPCYHNYIEFRMIKVLCNYLERIKVVMTEKVAEITNGTSVEKNRTELETLRTKEKKLEKSIENFKAKAQQVKKLILAKNGERNSKKFQELLKLVGSLDPKDKCLIFAKELSVVYALSDAFNGYFGLCAGAVVGTSGQSTAKSIRILQQFSGHKEPPLRIVVSTTACEEGLDIRDCNVVINFSENKTTRQWEQRKGRARTKLATIYLFHNDATEEENKSKLMKETVTTNTENDFEEERKKAEKNLCYEFSKGAEMFLWNAQHLLNEYCMNVKIHREEIKERLQQETVLIGIKFPTPEGWEFLYLNRTDDEEKERAKLERKNKNYKLAFLSYCAVKHLHKEGWLDKRGSPIDSFCSVARERCKADYGDAKADIDGKSSKGFKASSASSEEKENKELKCEFKAISTDGSSVATIKIKEQGGELIVKNDEGSHVVFLGDIIDLVDIKFSDDNSVWGRYSCGKTERLFESRR
mmetsp:Transcript_7010/g.10713  ORF Transcript_7010/g.10713 Transcript_7010/m.10713 type:complete len:786 (+) Transcript_7010:29-2386(+)